MRFMETLTEKRLTHHNEVFAMHGHLLQENRTPTDDSWFYDALSDGIIFRDELPSGVPVELAHCLRYFFNHRAKILCGEEECSEWPAFYALAKKHFPD